MSEPASRRPGIPPFAISGITFECRWVGDNSGRYEWRSTCGRALAWRIVGVYGASADGRELGRGFASLRLAMQRAADALNERRAAA